MQGLTAYQFFVKRCFDVGMALLLLFLLWWLMIAAFVIASIETKSNGFFTQVRVGRNGKLFKVIKIKTMRPVQGVDTTVTTSADPRITKSGAFFRKTKMDELPQLVNVLMGDMSFVGPRPDVPGFADKLEGSDRLMLTIRPGITGPATLKYRNEEALLAMQANPEKYNRDVIFPDKVKINIDYIQHWNFSNDIKLLWRTVKG